MFMRTGLRTIPPPMPTIPAMRPAATVTRTSLAISPGERERCSPEEAISTSLRGASGATHRGAGQRADVLYMP